MHTGLGPSEVDWPLAVWGTLLFLAPGWAWMWASGIRAGPLVFALLGPILGVAAVAGSTYVLNLAVGVPIRASTALGIATALAASGLALAVVRRLDLVEALPA